MSKITLMIARGVRGDGTRWKPKRRTLTALMRDLVTPAYEMPCTKRDWDKMPEAKRKAFKDTTALPYYVGARAKPDTTRSDGNVQARTLFTFDLEKGEKPNAPNTEHPPPLEQIHARLKARGVAHAIVESMSSTKAAPRARLNVVPDGDVPAGEYAQAARACAAALGIPEACIDPASYVLSQPMFAPVRFKDGWEPRGYTHAGARYAWRANGTARPDAFEQMPAPDRADLPEPPPLAVGIAMLQAKVFDPDRPLMAAKDDTAPGWIAVLLAYRDDYGHAAREAVEAWSKPGRTYTPESFAKHWNSRGRDKGPRRCVDDLYRYALRQGWALPASAAPEVLDIFNNRVEHHLPPLLGADDLPQVLYEFAMADAAITGHDPAAYFGACTAAAMGAVSIWARIGLPGNEGWSEPANGFIVSVANSGSGKSGVRSAAWQPHKRYLEEMERDYQRQMVRHKQKKLDVKPEPPAYITTDQATPEGVQRLLAAQPHSLSITPDELSVFFSTHNKYANDSGNRSNTTQELVPLWGPGSYAKDLAGGGRLYIPNYMATIYGTIQTTIWAETLDNSRRSSGFIARWMPIVAVNDYKGQMKDAKLRGLDDFGPHKDRQRAATRAWCAALGHVLRYDLTEEHRYVLDGAAAKLFVKWQIELLDRRHAANQAGYFAEEEALGKAESCVLRVALAYHFLLWGSANAKRDEPPPVPDRVTVDAVRYAITFYEWTFKHQSALYDNSGSSTSRVYVARRVASTLLRHTKTPGGVITTRTIAMHCKDWREADDRMRQRVIQYLMDCGWLLEDLTDRRRNALYGTKWTTNPRIWEDLGERVKLVLAEREEGWRTVQRIVEEVRRKQ